MFVYNAMSMQWRVLSSVYNACHCKLLTFYVTAQIQFSVQIRPRLLISCLNGAATTLTLMLTVFVK